MSNVAKKMSLNQALTIAEKLVARLAPTCERIEIGGSIRRQKAEIGDIEIVAIQCGKALHATLDKALSEDRLRHTAPKRWGEKMRSFLMTVGEREVKVDLFIVFPETWGVQFLIRTGSGIFSRNMVAVPSLGGFMPDGYRVQDGRVWLAGDRALRYVKPPSIQHDAGVMETPGEADVFRLWGMDFVPPAERTDSYRPKSLRPPDVEASSVQVGQLAMFGDAPSAERWTR